jgi:hypothetical protein
MFRLSTHFAAPTLLSLALLAGCAENPHNSPSLAPRSIERLSVAAPEEQAPVIALLPPDAPLPQKLGLLVDQARKADEQFKASIDPTRSLVTAAANAERGTENWVVAQQAITRLDSLRSPVRDALQKLDGLQSETVYSGGSLAEIASLDKALSNVVDLDTFESSTIAEISGSLSRP